MRTCITILLFLSSLCLAGICPASPPQAAAGNRPDGGMLVLQNHIAASQSQLKHPANTKFETDQRGVKRVVQTGFIIYKTFISSQDHMSCVFSPSCSEYALQSMQKQGFFPGLLNTFDRLTRCNGLRPGDYVIDPRLRLLSDPVRDIHYEAL